MQHNARVFVEREWVNEYARLVCRSGEEVLRQRGPLVWRRVVARDDGELAPLHAAADELLRCITRHHAATEDEILEIRHLPELRPSICNPGAVYSP